MQETYQGYLLRSALKKILVDQPQMYEEVVLQADTERLARSSWRLGAVHYVYALQKLLEIPDRVDLEPSMLLEGEEDDGPVYPN